MNAGESFRWVAFSPAVGLAGGGPLLRRLRDFIFPAGIDNVLHLMKCRTGQAGGEAFFLHVRRCRGRAKAGKRLRAVMRKGPFAGRHWDHELPSWAIVVHAQQFTVNTAAVHNSSAVSLFLLLVVVVTYVPASSAKRKRSAFSDGPPKGTEGRPFLLTCAPLAAL